MKDEIVTCKKCGKQYGVRVIRYPANMEEGRSWNTYYYCPYCKDTVTVHLSSDEDVMSYKIENDKS